MKKVEYFLEAYSFLAKISGISMLGVCCRELYVKAGKVLRVFDKSVALALVNKISYRDIYRNRFANLVDKQGT